MPNTKMTPEKFREHVYYHKFIYLAIVAAALMVGSILFTTTSYRAPNERRIDIELIGDYADTGSQTALEATEHLLEFGKAWETARDAAAGVDTESKDYEPALQELSAISLTYSDDGTGENDYYASQKYLVMLAAQEGDIYFVSRPRMVELIDNNIAVPLDDYIAQGVIDPGARSLGSVTFDERDDSGAATGAQHVYGLQAETMLGLAETFYYNPTNKYAVIVSFSKNQDTAAAILGEMLRLYDTEPEETAEDGAEAGEAPSENAGAFYQPDDEPEETADQTAETTESTETTETTEAAEAGETP